MMDDLCLRAFSGLSLDWLWTVFELSLNCLWTVSGLSQDCLWTVFGLSLDCLWTISGLSLDCLWTVSGGEILKYMYNRSGNDNICPKMMCFIYCRSPDFKGLMGQQKSGEAL